MTKNNYDKYQNTILQLLNVYYDYCLIPIKLL